MLVEIVSSSKQMELLVTNTKSGLLRVGERLVGVALGGQTLARYSISWKVSIEFKTARIFRNGVGLEYLWGKAWVLSLDHLKMIHKM